MVAVHNKGVRSKTSIRQKFGRHTPEFFGARRGEDKLRAPLLQVTKGFYILRYFFRGGLPIAAQRIDSDSLL